ncbi:MAG TPA: hypothetical protein VIP11_24380 [Gemmatimonadaceae bacterium]
MRVFWTLLKIIVGLAIAIPVGLLALALMAGFVGTLVGIAVLALKLACIGLVGYGLYRVARFMFAPKTPAPVVHELPRSDPYYDAAMRELDAEFRGPARS